MAKSAKQWSKDTLNFIKKVWPGLYKKMYNKMNDEMHENNGNIKKSAAESALDAVTGHTNTVNDSLEDKINETIDSIKKGFDDFKKGLGQEFNMSDLSEYLKYFADSLSGKWQIEHYNRADELAEQTEKFNEQYSKETLAEQASQFKQSQELAQKNLDYQMDISNKNLALQQDAFNAQLRENEITRQREDNAYQRQVADLKAAGFSPLMASNGASASMGQVMNSPQQEMSAVSSAQGSLVNLAAQYAELRAMAKGEYLNRKNQAANMRIGAQQVLAELGMKNQEFGMSLLNQQINNRLAFNRYENEKRSTDEKIRVSQLESAWNEEHGYRNQNTLSLLLPYISKISDKINLSPDSIADAIGKGFGKVSDTLQNIINGSPDRNSLPETTKQLTSNLSDDELMEAALLVALNPKITDKNIDSIASTLYPKLPKNRQNGYDNFKSWIKRDGIKNVLSVAFGLR